MYYEAIVRRFLGEVGEVIIKLNYVFVKKEGRKLKIFLEPFEGAVCVELKNLKNMNSFNLDEATKLLCEDIARVRGLIRRG